MATTTLSVSLLSGKGGVGKTNVALNLACALHEQGFKILLMDCDLGLANLDVLLGITPEGNLQTALLGESKIADVLCPVAPQGFDVLPAASGVPELTDLQPDPATCSFPAWNPCCTTTTMCSWTKARASPRPCRPLRPWPPYVWSSSRRNQPLSPTATP